MESDIGNDIFIGVVNAEPKDCQISDVVSLQSTLNLTPLGWRDDCLHKQFTGWMSNIFWGALSSKTVKLKKSYSRFVVASVYSNCATVNVCPWLALPRVYHLNSPLGDSHAMHTALKRSVNHTAEELCVGMSLFSAYYPNPGLYSSKKLSLHLTNHFTKLPLMQQQNLLSDKRAYRNTRIFSVLKMRILTFTVDSTVYSSLLDCPY